MNNHKECLQRNEERLPRRCDEVRRTRIREMETLDGMLDLGFALVRRKSRLRFVLYRSGGVGI